MHIEGYREEGSMTTPFDMMLGNHVSRYRVAGETVRRAALFNGRIALRSMELGGELQGRIKRDQKFIFEHGVKSWRRLVFLVFILSCTLSQLWSNLSALLRISLNNFMAWVPINTITKMIGIHAENKF